MAAKERWKMLKTVLLEKKSVNNTPTYEAVDPSMTNSGRRFLSFDLFTVNCSSNGGSVDLVTENQQVDGAAATTACRNSVTWTRYCYTSSSGLEDQEPGLDLSVEVALLPSLFSLEDLQGFNNTGNVCIWPAEEVMAYYCLERREMFRGSTVCELGAGMTGLTGIFLAKTGLPNKVIITDGNEKSVKNIQSIIDRNQLSRKCVPDVKAEVVVWNNTTDIAQVYQHLQQQCDIVLCADCLFFTEVHEGLLSLLRVILKPCTGRVIMLAPSRNATLHSFCGLAEKYFDIETTEDYLRLVSMKHSSFLKNFAGIYDPDIHYPIMLTMKQIMK